MANVPAILSGAVLAAGAAFSFANKFFFVVEPGTAVVKFDRFQGGIKPEIYTEGFNWILPWVQTAFTYETRNRAALVKTITGTKDLQTVNITLRILFRPNPSALPSIHRTLGENYMNVVFPSISNEILKGVVAQFNAEELITKRHVVSSRVRSQMSHRSAEEFNLLVEDIALMDISFSEEFSRAVEQKQVAQQEAERYKYVVLRNEHQREAGITRAEGEANAANLISKALQKHGNALLEIRRLEAAKAIATELAANPKVTFLMQNVNPLLPMRSN
eukprot:TRINITY_DN37509_c0_g1_i1.p1 TRINITY_DN37509_c0_g1~~TRINITY_DN37509_c0_g1_i1.p1  ORF type:complete len:275 (+),score=80.84 TRINITY_DN37509_c0_g1_i1:85-909(+)